MLLLLRYNLYENNYFVFGRNVNIFYLVFIYLLKSKSVLFFFLLFFLILFFFIYYYNKVVNNVLFIRIIIIKRFTLEEYWEIFILLLQSKYLYILIILGTDCVERMRRSFYY